MYTLDYKVLETIGFVAIIKNIWGDYDEVKNI
jgi:hypothetical protein